MENFMYLKGFRRKASSERKKMKLLFIYCEREQDREGFRLTRNLSHHIHPHIKRMTANLNAWDGRTNPSEISKRVLTINST